METGQENGSCRSSSGEVKTTESSDSGIEMIECGAGGGGDGEGGDSGSGGGDCGGGGGGGGGGGSPPSHSVTPLSDEVSQRSKINPLLQQNKKVVHTSL